MAIGQIINKRHDDDFIYNVHNEVDDNDDDVVDCKSKCIECSKNI